MTLRIIKGPEAAPVEPLLELQTAVIGFGNQGHAHALNLRDSGVKTIIGAREDSESWRYAARLGFDVLPVSEAVSSGDLVIMALPDEVQQAVWVRSIEPNLKPGAIVGVLHGFSLRFGLIKPASGVGVVMVAPKGPGTLLRARFVQGRGLPALFAMHQESNLRSAEQIGLAWAAGIGCARAAIVATTVADETETDLFGEQAVLCGGLVELIRAAFHTLVTAGYSPELAYMECCQEVKQIADLVYERGLAGMMQAISNTAEFGAYASGPRIIDQAVRSNLADLLEEIRAGRFADRLHRDHADGFPWFESERRRLAGNAIEEAGRAVRNWMSGMDTAEASETREAHDGTDRAI